MSELFEWSQGLFAKALPALDNVFASWSSSLDVLLASSATAFIALAQDPARMCDQATYEQYVAVAAAVDQLLTVESDRIVKLAAHAEEWCTDGVWHVIIPALLSIRRSLALFAQTSQVPHMSEHPASLARTLDRLFEQHSVFKPVATTRSVSHHSSSNLKLPSTSSVHLSVVPAGRP